VTNLGIVLLSVWSLTVRSLHFIPLIGERRLLSVGGWIGEEFLTLSFLHSLDFNGLPIETPVYLLGKLIAELSLGHRGESFAFLDMPLPLVGMAV
jgi:hypothetical protein